MLPTHKLVVACLLQSCAIGLTLYAGGAQNAVAAEPSACVASYRSSQMRGSPMPPIRVRRVFADSSRARA